MRKWFGLFGLWLTATVMAQSPEDAPQEPPTRPAVPWDSVRRLIGSFQSLGNWEEHYGYLVSATEKVYERQGWNSESDAFSLDLIRSVESIPPWAVQDRFDTLINTLSDRYLLDESQEKYLRTTVARLSNETFSKHSDRIMKYAVEAIQTRAAGEPFTAEQVQRWAELAEPVFLDSRERIRQESATFAERLDPEQRAILERDLSAANRRMDRMHELGRTWIQGQWRPDDWGMENDPIQIAGEAKRAANEPVNPANIPGRADPASEPNAHPPADDAPDANPAQPSENPIGPQGSFNPDGSPEGPRIERAARPKDVANDPWAAYVDAFIQKYKLNNEQSQRGWQIFGEVKARRDEMQSRYAKRQESLNVEQLRGPAGIQLRAGHDSNIERLFDQMTRRLDKLPTRAQRKDAKAGDLPMPIPRKTPAPASAPGSK